MNSVKIAKKLIMINKNVLLKISTSRFKISTYSICKLLWEAGELVYP